MVSSRYFISGSVPEAKKVLYLPITLMAFRSSPVSQCLAGCLFVRTAHSVHTPHFEQHVNELSSTHSLQCVHLRTVGRVELNWERLKFLQHCLWSGDVQGSVEGRNIGEHVGNTETRRRTQCKHSTSHKLKSTLGPTVSGFVRTNMSLWMGCRGGSLLISYSSWRSMELRT